ncbi:DEKNAAC105318 [Brettanomyces naardenensis]|uniref:DEKNAAC105318 n=1 Tax=Brettanomyces naardenensis TaxID=13370 RepID=A0A448YTE9_BRENA|nr:DEKNAAC105318 [Brettanomyces naardenensis]
MSDIDSINSNSSNTSNHHVTFGLIEQVDSPALSAVQRRQSTAPSFQSGAFSSLKEAQTNRSNLNDIIPPPVPESLPTTPGYELNGTSYFDLPDSKAVGLPHQQTVLASNDESNHLLEDVSHGVPLDRAPRNKWRLAATIIFAMSAGLSDGAPGALLPRVENFYGITYTIVSLIWMANAAGFIVIALFSHKLQPVLGAWKMLGFGCACLLVMYSMVCPAPRFPIIVVGFFFGGLGLATNISFQNIFLSRLKGSSIYLGLFHGAYGLGACIGPLAATAMVNQGVKWSYYYFILLSLSAFNMVNLALSFNCYEEDFKVWDRYEPLEEARNGESIELVRVAEGSSNGQTGGARASSAKAAKSSKSSKAAKAGNVQTTTYEEVNPPKASAGTQELHAALNSPITWYLAFFVLFYQGAEVSMGGWVVTFLEVYRHGSTKTTGYVASGFWGGLTLGRLFLTPSIHRFIGSKRGVTLLILASLACCLLTWLVPVFLVEAVFVALFGLFIGPIYPLMITIAVRVLPRKIQVISLTIMTALGSSGGAIFPFLVGLVSQVAGTYVVMPFVFGLLGSTLGLWYLLPNPDRMVVKGGWERLL